MNIFASFPDPVKSARWLDDQRQVKMPLESAQMFSTVAHIYGVWREPMLKPTHKMHPCTLWVGEGRDNWDWLWEHMMALDEFRCVRGNPNQNKAIRRLMSAKAWQLRNYLPYGGTPHKNCARNSTLGIDFTHVADTHKAYRLYLKARWLKQDKLAVCTLPKDFYE